MEQQQLVEKRKLDALRKIDVIAYSLGHFMNDLGASFFFTYFLYFTIDVIGLNSGLAGVIVLIGQLTDTICTPLTGYFSDKIDTKIGKRKPWYIIGSVIQTTSVFLMYQTCLWCSGTAETNQLQFFIYYLILIITLNIGFAFVQINHMSLVPQLTYDGNTRNKLVGYVNSATFSANACVLIISFIVIRMVNTPYLQFSLISIIVCCIGYPFCIFFMCTLNEPYLVTEAEKLKKLNDEKMMDGANDKQEECESAKLRAQVCRKESKKGSIILQQQKGKSMAKSRALDASIVSPFNVGQSLAFANSNLIKTIAAENEQGIPDTSQINCREILGQIDYYLCALIYMTARLANNLGMSMLPFYLILCLNVGGVTSSKDTKDKTPWQLAVAPLLMYLGSSLAAFQMNKLAAVLSKKFVYGIGTLIVCVCLVFFVFLQPSFYYWIFVLCFIMGMGLSTQLATAMSVIADFVGPKGKEGAFIYASFSLFDKMLSGLTLFIITNSQMFKDENPLFIRILMISLPMSTSIIGFISSMFSSIKAYGASDDEINNLENDLKKEYGIIKEEIEMQSSDDNKN